MTTAAVVAYYSQSTEAKISYAGHPPVLYKRVSDKVWSFARPSSEKGERDGQPLNIPLAVDSDTLYGQMSISMATGDRLFVYTDGIIDAPNPEGESFGLIRLKNVLDKNINASHSEIKSAVLHSVTQYTKKDLSHDDVTLIVLEIC
jgi:sigma-B regulation protein RsbU (phosphoserine phosphatase)